MARPRGPRPQRTRRVNDVVLQQLRQPLDPQLVSERTTDDGEVLRYLEGWRVIEQANGIFGHGRWGAELVDEVVYRPLPASGRTRSGPPAGIYTATVRVVVDGCLPHSDVGVGAVAEQTPEAHATAYKAAVTDGLKRALRHFGARFGSELAAGVEEPPLPETAPPEALRRQVLEIAASAGSDEAQIRAWVTQRYGRPLDELDVRSLLHAVRACSRALERRNGHTQAA